MLTKGVAMLTRLVRQVLLVLWRAPCIQVGGFGRQCMFREDCLHIPSQSYVDRHAEVLPPELSISCEKE